MHKRFYKLKTKTAIVIFIFILIAMILMQGTLAVYNVYESKKHSLDMASLIISRDTQNMTDMFSRIEFLTNTIENDKSFMYLPASRCSGNIIKDSKEFNMLHEKFSMYISNVSISNSSFNSFIFLDDSLPLTYVSPLFSGINELYTQMGVSKIYSMNNIINTSWFNELDEVADTLIWTQKAKNRQLLCYAKKLSLKVVEHNKVKLYPIGVFYFSCDLATLLSQLELTNIYPSSVITLLYDNNIIYQSGEITSNTQNRTLDYASSIYSGLALQTSISLKDINSSFTAQTFIMLLMFLLMLLFGVLVLSYISNAILNPVRSMANHLLEDDFSTLTYKNKLNPEMEVLYDNHNYMVERTKNAMDESRRSYYKMLQAQINPHFIYNALNSISAMSIMNGNAEMAEAISSLVMMLRYGINSPDALSSIEKEMEIIDAFISIQNFRYDNNVNILYDIPTELLNTEMPKLTLQPLIENSVFHSDKSLAQFDINITITAKRIDDDIIIEIYDQNSVSPDVLNRQLHNNAEDNIQKRRGIGIRNINQRLVFMFGDKYGIEYKNHSDGLCTIIRLPYKKGE